MISPKGSQDHDIRQPLQVAPFRRPYHPAVRALVSALLPQLSGSGREEMMAERELKVDHTTIYRWVQKYAPELEKRCKPHLKQTTDSWRVDETYVKVNGKWLWAIHPPRRGEETDGRFRPYGGSSNWISRVDGTGERDRGKWQIVAVSDTPADYTQVEAECVVAGIQYEYARPHWRQQIGSGLEITLPFEDFMELCVSLGQSPTQAGRVGLAGGTGLVVNL
jgi:hypothetical protein